VRAASSTTLHPVPQGSTACHPTSWRSYLRVGPPRHSGRLETVAAPLGQEPTGPRTIDSTWLSDGCALAGRSNGVSPVARVPSVREMFRGCWPGRQASRVYRSGEHQRCASAHTAVSDGIRDSSWPAVLWNGLGRARRRGVRGQASTSWRQATCGPLAPKVSRPRPRSSSSLSTSAYGRAGPNALTICFSDRRFAHITSGRRCCCQQPERPCDFRRLVDPDLFPGMSLAGKAHPADQPGIGNDRRSRRSPGSSMVGHRVCLLQGLTT